LPSKREIAFSEEYREAKRKLSLFVVAQALETACRLGFGWEAKNDAPSQYTDLVEAFDRSVMTGEALAVSSLYCTNVIYSGSKVNHAMRFWHDAHHVQLGLNFSPADELELGLWHGAQLLKAGFSRDSLEYRMIKIDTVGQNYLLAINGKFPENQLLFVERCLELGVDEGVLEEARGQLSMS
jgi:hypothetical protein